MRKETLGMTRKRLKQKTRSKKKAVDARKKREEKAANKKRAKGDE